MILDSLTNHRQAASCHPLFPKAFAYLLSFEDSIPDGKYNIDGDQVVAIVSRYETAPEPEKAWEAHRFHADIQFVASGREVMFHCPLAEFVSSNPYNKEKDVEKFSGEGVLSASRLIVPAGSFCVFLPQDGHKPGCCEESPGPVVKVVIKVRLDDAGLA